VLVWLGVLSALPGIWLVSSEPPGEEPTGSLAEGLADGVLAGLGFGLLFAAIGQVPDTAGMWPLALGHGVSILAAVSLAVVLRADWLPRERTAAWGLVAGPLGAAAAVFFLLATQQGYLTVSGVIASLYPAATVLLAATVLRERVHATQGLGLLLCGAAIALVASG
jgi:drug/metabolite transporter (DMT)-like permease